MSLREKGADAPVGPITPEENADALAVIGRLLLLLLEQDPKQWRKNAVVLTAAEFWVMERLESLPPV